ncbi:signal peptidase I [Fictibacillus macauensis ZFHKF-1]|uniref:Signal peptidase I n=1 Tax=Fictibacillus macauensis ZFHKF-1 TaxID=1196324 RepID=I8AJQ1_9BACL|nr:signal peptidase I [Fictibacillus macauensis]EIT86002.1 signal peptidase I [Fictibacillus macauensis ZFHKF-1]
MRSKNQIWDWIKAIGIALILAIIIKKFLFEQYVVYGQSMMPAIENGNRLIINKVSYLFSNPKRFDLVVFHANKNEDYIKRVIGVPGDSIVYKNDELYVNGKKVKEPFLEKYRKNILSGSFTGDFTLKEITGYAKIPKGKVFVMGDNRLHSTDSRLLGLVNTDRIVGKVNLRYWPINELKIIH